MHRLVVLGLLLTLSACATVETVATQPAIIREVNETNYRIGTEQSAVVGDPIVRVRRYTVEEREVAVVQANTECRVLGGGYDIQFARGQTLPISGRRPVSEGGFLIVSVETSQLGIPATLDLQIDENGRIQPKAVNGGVLYSYRPEPADCRLIPVERAEILSSRPYVNYEIVFNGSDGQAMRFTYREFSPEDLARTAFYQDLSYPLGSNTIQFRKLVIEVVNLTPQSLSYVVRSDF